MSTMFEVAELKKRMSDALGYVLVGWRAISQLRTLEIITANQRFNLPLDERHVWFKPTGQNLDDLCDKLRMPEFLALPK